MGNVVDNYDIDRKSIFKLATNYMNNNELRNFNYKYLMGYNLNQ